MKKFARLVGILLCFAMVMSMLPATVIGAVNPGTTSTGEIAQGRVLNIYPATNISTVFGCYTDGTGADESTLWDGQDGYCVTDGWFGRAGYSECTSAEGLIALVMTLSTPITLGGMEMVSHGAEYSPTDFEVQALVDGNWVTVFTQETNAFTSNLTQLFDFGTDTVTSKVRVLINEVAGGATCRFKEVTLYEASTGNKYEIIDIAGRATSTDANAGSPASSFATADKSDTTLASNVTIDLTQYGAPTTVDGFNLFCYRANQNTPSNVKVEIKKTADGSFEEIGTFSTGWNGSYPSDTLVAKFDQSYDAYSIRFSFNNWGYTNGVELFQYVRETTAEATKPAPTLPPEGTTKIDLTNSVVGCDSQDSATQSDYTKLTWYSSINPGWKDLSIFTDGDYTNEVHWGLDPNERADVYIDLTKNNNGAAVAVNQFKLYHSTYRAVNSVFFALVLDDGTVVENTATLGWLEGVAADPFVFDYDQTYTAVGLYVWQPDNNATSNIRAAFGEIELYYIAGSDTPVDPDAPVIVKVTGLAPEFGYYTDGTTGAITPYYLSGREPANLVDGSSSTQTRSDYYLHEDIATNAKTPVILFELGETKVLTSIKIEGYEYERYNMEDFEIQVSNSTGADNWTTVATVTDAFRDGTNGDDVSPMTIDLGGVSANKIRVLISGITDMSAEMEDETDTELLLGGYIRVKEITLFENTNATPEEPTEPEVPTEPTEPETEPTEPAEPAGNTIEIESYGNAEWTAPEDGYVKFTINIEGAMLAVLNGFTPLAEDTDSVTVQVTAGTTYGIYPGYNVTTNSVVTWEYVEAPEIEEPVIEAIPSGSELALGDNNVILNYATVPMMANYWTYTALDAGELTITVTSINGNTDLGIPFGMNRYTLVVGETDGMGTNTVTVSLNAGDTVNVAVLNSVDFNDVPAVINVAFTTAEEPTDEKNPADYFETDENGYYIIPTLETPVDIFVGDADIYYVYTAEADGAVYMAPAEGTEGGYLFVVGEEWLNSEGVNVTAGDTILINIWGGFEGTVSLGDAIVEEPGDNEPTDEKDPSNFFLTDEEGNFIIDSLLEYPVDIYVGNNDINYIYTAEADGIVTVTPTVEDEMTATNIWIIHNGAVDTTAAPVTVVAGDTVIINVWSGYEGTVTLTVDGVTPELPTEPTEPTEPSEPVDPDDNTIEIESYGNAEWTAPEDGYVKFTINIEGATLAVLEGFSLKGEGTDSITVKVTAGTTYGVYPGADVTTDSVVTWEYVEAPVVDEPESLNKGDALALGLNNVTLTYATRPAMANYWTYTATENGYVTVTVTSINGETNLGMAFGRGMYTLLVGETDGMGTNSASVYMTAGETINVAVLDTMDMSDVPATLNVAFAAGEPIVEKDPADYFTTDDNGNFVIESLETPVDIFVGNNDICYVYTAEADGTVTVTNTAGEAGNCWIKVNDGGWEYFSATATVVAGDVVTINIWNGYEGTVSLEIAEVEEPDEPVIVETNALSQVTYNVRLIEPWAMRINVKFFSGTQSNPVNVPVSSMTAFGAYGILASKYENADNLSIEELIADPDAIKIDMSETEADGSIYAVDANTLRFDFSDDIYTYRLSEAVYWIAYYVDVDGNYHYTRVRSKTLTSVIDGLTSAGEKEANVYTSMKAMETAIIAYRGTLSNLGTVYPAGVNIVESGIGFAADNAPGTYMFAQTHSIKLIEPWGIKVNVLMVTASDRATIDYAAADDYGLIFFHDKAGVYADGMSVEEMLAEGNAVVYSKSLGNATIEAGRVSAIYDQNIFTFEMDSNLYCLPYVVIDGEYHYRNTGAFNMNLIERVGVFANEVDKYSAEERAVYAAMVEMNENILIYRGQ